GHDLHGQVVGQLFELLRPGDEVGLAVDLDDGADPAGVDVALNQPLGGHAVCLLFGVSDALLREVTRGFVDVAVGLLQRALAVHNAGVGELAKVLYQVESYVCHQAPAVASCGAALSASGAASSVSSPGVGSSGEAVYERWPSPSSNSSPSP